MNAKITVIDYGVGNLFSIAHAFGHVGANVRMTSNPTEIATADRLILPGVGAFAKGMQGLTEQGMDNAIREFALRERPFLGICLGMQMMLDKSFEFGAWDGLGLIPGNVERIPDTGVDGRPHKIPHIGWNRIRPVTGGRDWAGTMLDGLPEGTRGYFVHSYTPVPSDESHRLADTDYDGRRLSAVIARGPMYGTQFHPEKSGPQGLAMLVNFLQL